MLYGFGQQGPAQGHFEVVPQYQTRQSAAIDVLSNQFAVPQYFAPEESAGSGVAALSPYLNAQLQPYNQGPMARPNTTQSFSAPISDFSAIGSGSMNRLDQPQTESQQQQSDQPSLEEAIGRYQHILRRTFDQTRAGRLVEAGGSLLEISEWLVTHARDLGKMHSFSVSYCFLFFRLEKTEEQVSTLCYDSPRLVAQKSHFELDPSFSCSFHLMSVSEPAGARHASII
jgi:hypothetical protein